MAGTSAGAKKGWASRKGHGMTPGVKVLHNAPASAHLQRGRQAIVAIKAREKGKRTDMDKGIVQSMSHKGKGSRIGGVGKTWPRSYVKAGGKNRAQSRTTNQFGFRRPPREVNARRKGFSSAEFRALRTRKG